VHGASEDIRANEEPAMSETKALWGLLAVGLALVVSLHCHSMCCQAAEPAGEIDIRSRK
jgi:hypothetical protein